MLDGPVKDRKWNHRPVNISCRSKEELKCEQLLKTDTGLTSSQWDWQRSASWLWKSQFHLLTDHIVLTLKLGLTWKNGKSLHRVVRSARRPKRTPVQPVRKGFVSPRINTATMLKGTVINLRIHHWIDHEDCRCFPFLARPCRSHRAHPRQLGLRNCRKDDFRQVPRSLYVSLNLWGFWVPRLWVCSY